LDLEIFDRGCSVAVRDGVGVSSSFSTTSAGTDSSVELLDLLPSSGLREKSFAIEPHLKLRSLPVDFLEIEPEPLLLDWKIPVDILRFSLFSTKASNPPEPMVGILSLFVFWVFDSVAVGSGLSWIVS
jgi:hypothetical protein